MVAIDLRYGVVLADMGQKGEPIHTRPIDIGHDDIDIAMVP